MAFAIAYPQINGHRYSFASIEATFNGISTLGITSINYGDKLNPGKVYGTAPQVIGRTRGKNEPTADFEMLKLEFENLRQTLGPNGDGNGYGETPFDITCAYTESIGTTTDTVYQARITGADASNTEGTDATKMKVTLDPLRILLNGATIATALSPMGI